MSRDIFFSKNGRFWTMTQGGGCLKLAKKCYVLFQWPRCRMICLMVYKLHVWINWSLFLRVVDEYLSHTYKITTFSKGSLKTFFSEICFEIAIIWIKVRSSQALKRCSWTQSGVNPIKNSVVLKRDFDCKLTQSCFLNLIKISMEFKPGIIDVIVLTLLLAWSLKLGIIYVIVLTLVLSAIEYIFIACCKSVLKHISFYTSFKMSFFIYFFANSRK
jgi:hypothetical protein